MGVNAGAARISASGRSRPGRARAVSADPLSRAAGRLLRALDGPDSSVGPDPLDGNAVVVARASGAVSLGGGRHAAAALAELEGRDLVWRLPGPGRPRFGLSEPGRAHLRRLSAPAGTEAFGAQQRELERAVLDEPDGARNVLVNAAESPLGWLRRRRDRDGEPLIDAASYEAGERLRRDIATAGMLPSVTARWEGAVGSGGAALRDPASAADAVVAARQRVRSALAAVGPEHGDLLLDLCGFLKGLEVLERERGWPPRSAKVVARMALGALARHYGLAATASGPERSRGIRRWDDGA